MIAVGTIGGLRVGLGTNRPRGIRTPLDLIATPSAAAYSVRKMRAAYTGLALRVRRSSDNAEQDIGFNSLGNLNTEALLAFTGAGSGFVTTWYDQSGNVRNAVQATAVLQPRIVNSGTMEAINGKPAVVLASTTLRSASGVDTPIATIVTVTGAPVLTSNLFNPARPFALAGPVDGSRRSFAPATDGSLRYDGGFTVGAVLPAIPYIRTATRTTASANDWRNGLAGISTVESLPNISGPAVPAFNPLIVVDAELICEAICFLSALGTGDRQTLERNQGMHYGITVA